MNTLRFGWTVAFCGLAALGCSSSDKDDKSTAPLEIVGKYMDSFKMEQTITATKWNTDAIVGYDNDANVVYTKIADDAMFNPGKYTKTVYTEPKNGSFYFCEVEFSLDTLADAKASTATADDSDPDNGGCGGMFAWTKATKE